MKILILGLVFLLGCTTIQRKPNSERSFVMRQIQNVGCKSGAILNPAETMKPGMSIPLQVPADYNEGNTLTVEIEMKTDGTEYISGKGACPKGDFLVIQFAAQ